MHLDVVQKAQVELLPNDVLLALLQEQPSAVVRPGDTPKEVLGDIIGVIARRPNGHCATVRVLMMVRPDMLQLESVRGWDDSRTRNDAIDSEGADSARKESGSKKLHGGFLTISTMASDLELTPFMNVECSVHDPLQCAVFIRTMRIVSPPVRGLNCDWSAIVDPPLGIGPSQVKICAISYSSPHSECGEMEKSG